MKKLTSVILAISIMVLLASCGATQQTEQNQASTARQTHTEEVVTMILTSKSFKSIVNDAIEEIGKKVTIDKTTDKAADMIGAEYGKGFTVGDKTFEIYYFEDESKITEAKSGKMTITIESLGDYEVNSVVNQNLVMIYETADDEVINAFKSVDY